MKNMQNRFNGKNEWSIEQLQIKYFVFCIDMQIVFEFVEKNRYDILIILLYWKRKSTIEIYMFHCNTYIIFIHW